MSIFVIFISSYLTIGTVFLFFPPLSDTLKDGYTELARRYFKEEKFEKQLLGLIGLIALIIITAFILAIFPIILFAKRNQPSTKDLEISTTQKFHSSKNLLVEESDYNFSGKKLVARRNYLYDDQDRLKEIHISNASETTIAIKTYEYNEKGQRFSETLRDISSSYEKRYFYLFDDLNRMSAVYGELESGHQYCHEFVYNSNGERITVAMSQLRRDLDLFDIFKNALKHTKEKKIVIEPFKNYYRSAKPARRSWSCSICDGDETTGCLYHDPAECPK